MGKKRKAYNKRRKTQVVQDSGLSSFIYEKRGVLPIAILTFIVLLCTFTFIAVYAGGAGNEAEGTPPPSAAASAAPATPDTSAAPSAEPTDAPDVSASPVVTAPPTAEPTPEASAEPSVTPSQPPPAPPSEAPPSDPPVTDPPEPESVSVPIIKLHHIIMDGGETNSDTITLTKLVELVARLQSSGYSTVTAAQLRSYVAGAGMLPEKPVMITFDDGYESNYTLAYPLLRDYGMHAVISVIGWSMGRFTYLDGISPIIRHLSWEQLGEMTQSGVFEVGNHTYNMHGSYMPEGGGRYGVTQLEGESDDDYKTELVADLNLVQDAAQEHLGFKPTIFCFPYGKNAANTYEIIREMGFDVILTTTEGVNELKVGDSLTRLKRVGVDMNTDIQAMIDSWSN